MNNRLKEIRLSLKLSQEEFGNHIGIESRAHISALEKGNRNITDRIIKDVCREFNINEEWLRFGTGEMHKSSKDNTANIISEILENDNPFYEIILDIVRTYQRLDQKSQETLQQFANMLLENQPKKEHD